MRVRRVDNGGDSEREVGKIEPSQYRGVCRQSSKALHACYGLAESRNMEISRWV